MDKTQHIDRYALSRACVEHVRQRLLTSGDRATQQNIARELGIKQPLVSRALAPSSPKAFSYETIDRYARALGTTLGQLCLELMTLIPRDDDTRIYPSPQPKYDLLEKLSGEMHSIRRALDMAHVGNGESVDKQYEGVLIAGTKVFRNAGIPILSSGICFRHGSGSHIYLASSILPPNPFVTYTTTAPRSFLAEIGKCWTVHSSSERHTTSTLIQPGNTQRQAEQRFWKSLTGTASCSLARKLSLHTSRICRGPGLDYCNELPEVTAFFVFEYRFDPTIEVQRAIASLSDMIHRVYALELQRYAETFAKLCKVAPIPSNIRSHATYYASKSKACPEKLEMDANAFLTELAKDNVVGRELGYMEIWSFDWTEARFVSLSPYFMHVADRVATLPVRQKGVRLSVRDVLTKTIESRAPRLHGKASFVLLSRRCLFVDVQLPSALQRGTSGKASRGTLVVLPLVILDAQEERRIYSVLYLQYEACIAGGGCITRRIAELSQRAYPDFVIDFAPPLASAFEETHPDPVVNEGMSASIYTASIS